MKRSLAVVACCALLGSLSGTAVAGPDDMFVVRAAAKPVDGVVKAIEAYAKEKKWQYLGADKVKKGQVTIVKVCIPAIGKQLWPLGLQVSAMLPCGNLGVYEKGGKTEISMLHPRYMHVLYPNATTEKASAAAEPLLMGLLEAVSK